MAVSGMLRTYLQDHHAGATAGLELARRAAGENDGSAYASEIAAIADEIEEDKRALDEIMKLLGVKPNPIKDAGGWTAEKLGRLKPNNRWFSYSPLSRVVELEGLALGVTGKLAVWKALRLIADTDPALDAAELDRLVDSAEEQQRGLEEHRLEAARGALAA